MINETKQIKATSKKKLDERVAATMTTMKMLHQKRRNIEIKDEKGVRLGIKIRDAFLSLDDNNVSVA